MEEKIFNRIVNICFEEDFSELQLEILSIQKQAEKDRNYSLAIELLMEAIPIYVEDFPNRLYRKIEKEYENYITLLEY